MKGPTTQTCSYKSCLNCDYHDQTLFKSGRNPEYLHSCLHPDAYPDEEKLAVATTGRQDRFIGRGSKTPSWCPYLRGSEK